MKKNVLIHLLAGIVMLMSSVICSGQVFKTVVLGSGGGIEESNLTAYLISPANSNEFICLDAGTVYSGIDKAVRYGHFYDVFVPPESEASKTGYIFRELIKGYLISHAHLDHVAGLVISSPANTSKPVYGSPLTIQQLKKNIFNWEIWPNFSNDGEGRHLNVFEYKTLIPGQAQKIEGTRFVVKAFPLSHQEPFQSSAFLLGYLGDYVLYVGDTGADELEGSQNLEDLWREVAPLIRDNKLSGIFLECSYPDERPDTQLYGHLNPKWMLKELNKLAQITNPGNTGDALAGLPVVVTGIKSSWKEGGDNKYLIYKQLLVSNKLGVRFIIPEQGQLIEF